MEKKLYPFKFIPVASRRPWGGNALVNDLGKKFVEVDSDGNESVLGSDVLIGESWELADMGIEPTESLSQQSLLRHFPTHTHFLMTGIKPSSA